MTGMFDYLDTTVCECGCYKTYGSPKMDPTHSDWCPWSPLYTVSFVGHRCEGALDDGACGEKATCWIKYAGELLDFYYCDSCYKNYLFGGRGIEDYGRLK